MSDAIVTLKLSPLAAEQLSKFLVEMLKAKLEIDTDRQEWEREKAERWTPEIISARRAEYRAALDKINPNWCSCRKQKAYDLHRAFEQDNSKFYHFSHPRHQDIGDIAYFAQEGGLFDAWPNWPLRWRNDGQDT